MKPLNSSKSRRLFDFVPSVKPSIISVILVFVCGVLWVKNETTNERLIALESRLHCFSCVKSISTENLDKINPSPTKDSAKYYYKNIRTPISEGIGHTYSAITWSKLALTTTRPRNRRQVLNDTLISVTLHDVRKEFSKQFEQLMPLKYCKSSEKVCPAGPPGLPGPTGAKGQRGRRGAKGKKGPKGPTGRPGKTGETGTSGPAGPRGEKGDKGEPGLKGMPGARGEKGNNGNPGTKGMPGTRGEKGSNGNPGPQGMPGPRGPKGDKGEPGSKGIPGQPGNPGKSASAPQVMLSPAQQTRNEGGNMAFYCTVRGNPPPTVEWRFKGKKLLPGAKYLIKVGELIVKNLNYSDAGQYTCHARNILGSSGATGNLSIRGLPVFTNVPPSHATPVERTNFQVVCKAEGFPRPVINWSRLGMPLPAGKTEVSQGTLTIKSLTTADSGLYECIATNTMGTKKASINVAVQQLKLDLEDSVIVGNSRNHLNKLRSWLSSVARSVNSGWKLCWRASVDGWAASTFHSRCDGKGPTVTIIRVGRYIFGGYTSRSWASSGVYQYDSKAFLFSLVNKPGWAPVKLSQTGKYSSRRTYSIFCGSGWGPYFGDGIGISNYASSNSNSLSNLGHTYSPPSGYSYGSTFARTFLAGTYKFTPEEVETFYETN